MTLTKSCLSGMVEVNSRLEWLRSKGKLKKREQQTSTVHSGESAAREKAEGCGGFMRW